MLVQSIPYPASGTPSPAFGPELVSNGTFDNDPAGWVGGSGASLSSVSGALRVANSGGSFSYASQGVPTNIGTQYRATGRHVGGTSGAWRFRIGSGANGVEIADISNGDMDQTFTATAETTYVTCFTGSAISGQYQDFDDISLKEVL